MKNIFRIFLNDLKSISKNLIVFIVIIGISILPALYAWFNIASNWDPYSSTNGLQFAVCSLDKGYSYKSININAGDKIVDNLKKNDKMGWTFVGEKEAIKGVKKGEYYAAVIIPKDFSECLLSLTTGKFEQAKLHYYVNEKKNAIAPKITDKGIEAIQESLSSEYVSTITKLIATTLNLSTETLDSTKDKAADTVVKAIDKANTELDKLSDGIDVYIKTTDTLKENINDKKKNIPAISKKITETQNAVSGTKNSVANTANAALQITNSLEASLLSAQSFAEDVTQRVNDAFAKVDTNTKEAADKFRSITAVNDRVTEIYQRIINVFTTIQDILDIDCSDIIERLNNFVQRQNEIKDTVNSIADNIEKGTEVTAEAKQKLDDLLNESSSDPQAITNSFANIREKINQTVTNAYKSVDNVSALLSNLNEKVPDFNSAFDNAAGLTDDTKEKLKGLKTSIENAKKKLGTLSMAIDLALNNSSIQSLIAPIVENPQALGEFVSSPVTVKKHQEFPLDNYGSGMTPFYSSLALWVGGIVLVAVMKVDLTKHELRKLNRPTNTQLFFGRYLIYFLLGQVQAWIIALGDIFFLKIQCDNPVMFVIGCLISSFVYTLIIYSLTITFSVIGKALAVIILVIQIAGSGGTFPIEVLPAPFQALAPYLPFKYGVNALREAVAGLKYSAYWNNILLLLAFVPFALILGLILRRPCIKPINFFNERIEQSDIIV